MENNMNVDIEELQKQKKEQIYKTGRYVEVSILVPKDKELDYFVEMNVKKASPLEVAKAVKIMKDLEEKIYKNDPMISVLENSIISKYRALKFDGEDNTITEL